MLQHLVFTHHQGYLFSDKKKTFEKVGRFLKNDNYNREILTGGRDVFNFSDGGSSCYNFKELEPFKKIPTHGLDKVTEASVTFMFPV